MSPGSRAFYGALVGALAVLIIHPASRPHIVQGLFFLPRQDLAAVTDEKEHDLLTISKIVKGGLERVIEGEKLSDSDLAPYISATTEAITADPDNAFWKQALACFQYIADDEAAAQKSLTSASLATRWRDYSIEAVSLAVQANTIGHGRSLAWHSAVAESLKSSTNERACLLVPRKIINELNDSDIDLRVMVFRNGVLVRDGSRSAEGSWLGLDLMEIAAIKPGHYSASPRFSDSLVSPKTLATARAKFAESAGRKDRSIKVEIENGYRKNDAWDAFINVPDAKRATWFYTLLSVLSASLPGALISVALLGAVILGIGAALRGSPQLQKLLTPPWTQFGGCIAGFAIYFSTRLVFPAIWATVVLASFGVRQDKNREGVPTGYSKYYGTSLTALAIGFSLVLTLSFLVSSPAGGFLADVVGVEDTLSHSDFALYSLSAVIASMALVTGSVWGFLLRVPSERLAGVSLVRFGSLVFFSCLALGILVAPPCIALDRIVGDRLTKIFQNEPTYYLSQ